MNEAFGTSRLRRAVDPLRAPRGSELFLSGRWREAPIHRHAIANTPDSSPSRTSRVDAPMLALGLLSARAG
jgi:hypothetical protein